MKNYFIALGLVFLLIGCSKAKEEKVPTVPTTQSDVSNKFSQDNLENLYLKFATYRNNISDVNHGSLTKEQNLSIIKAQYKLFGFKTDSWSLPFNEDHLLDPTWMKSF
jgi:hypothetical protein